MAVKKKYVQSHISSDIYLRCFKNYGEAQWQEWQELSLLQLQSEKEVSVLKITQKLLKKRKKKRKGKRKQDKKEK